MASSLNADPRPTDTEGLGKKRRRFRAFEENKRREIQEARLHRRYYYDKQWTAEEIRELNRRGQQPTVRNKIARKVDFLVGVEQRMRRDPKGYPRTPEDQQGADVVTAVIRYVCDDQRWQFKSSDCARDGLVSGVGIMFVGAQLNRKGKVDVRLKVGQVDRFFYDSRSVEHDFSDAKHLGMHLWFDLDEAKQRWPDQAKALDDMVGLNGDGHASLAADEDRDEQWADYEHNRVRIIEYWEQQADGWHFCFFSGDVELESGISPYLDEDGVPECPYVCWSPKVDEIGDRHGVVRTMVTIQDEINHRASRILHRLQSRQMYVREGVVEDVNELKRQMNRPDGVIQIHGGVWGQDIGVIDNGQQIQGEAELLTLAQSDIENLGPNPGLIGKGGGVAEQSGRAILAQRDSGMTELSPVFERLRDWKLRIYRAIYNRIVQFWKEERLVRITDNPEAPQFLAVNQYQIDPTTGQITSSNVLSEIDVDVIMDEGPDTITMQEELLERITQLGEAALSPLGELIIELSGVAGKERYLELIQRVRQEAQPPPDPAEQEAKRLALKKEDAEIRNTEADSQEKASVVELNQARALKEAAQAEQAIYTPIV